MHVRFSTCLGTPVSPDNGEGAAGVLSGILLHPDVGRVEGFFVRVAGALYTEQLFLASQDILHWGNRIRIHDAGVLGSLEERVRLHSLVLERRPVLGQRILTESGASLGVCRDVQFETKTFRIEWLFPRGWFRWRAGIPVTAIIEVRPDAVIVRDPAAAVVNGGAEAAVLKALDTLTEVPVPPRLPETF